MEISLIETPLRAEHLTSDGSRLYWIAADQLWTLTVGYAQTPRVVRDGPSDVLALAAAPGGHFLIDREHTLCWFDGFRCEQIVEGIADGTTLCVHGSNLYLRGDLPSGTTGVARLDRAHGALVTVIDTGTLTLIDGPLRLVLRRR
jgi:hypothetical protein